MPVVCVYCENIFSRQFTLNRHIREIHMQQVEPIAYSKVWSFKCLESGCDTSFQQGPFLVNYLEKVHHLKFKNETTIDFANKKGKFSFLL
jgi:(2Fe-2S) ferredoxin